MADDFQIYAGAAGAARMIAAHDTRWGFVSLAFAIGKGSEMQQPLAIAIISGLVVQLPLVLLLMPVLAWVTRRRGKQSG
jgi:multidrug efflux pump subunit AcrB